MTVLSKRKMELIKRMKPKREIAVIQREYTELASKAGDMQYKILCFQDELAQINARIRELNVEANQLQKDKQDGKADSSSIQDSPAADQSTGGEASLPPSISEYSGSAEHRENAQ